MAKKTKMSQREKLSKAAEEMADIIESHLDSLPQKRQGVIMGRVQRRLQKTARTVLGRERIYSKSSKPDQVVVIPLVARTAR